MISIRQRKIGWKLSLKENIYLHNAEKNKDYYIKIFILLKLFPNFCKFSITILKWIYSFAEKTY